MRIVESATVELTPSEFPPLCGEVEVFASSGFVFAQNEHDILWFDQEMQAWLPMNRDGGPGHDLPRDKPFKVSATRRSRHWARTDGRCWYCGTCFYSPSKMCMDHIHPRSQGGSDNDDNLVPCCKPCNSKKGSKDLESFRQAERAKRFGFSPEQTAYLESMGIALPPFHERPKHWFAVELEGWI